jgi:luciferase family oxidoreductase group 1
MALTQVVTLPLLSILDLATVGEGQTSSDALAYSTQAVQLAESLGYRRYWVAEHHNFSSVASTSPPVLIAHLAASTSTMSIGSGGVMLPNHPPLVVAEQFAMLEALHPGRIDLGVGRAPGTDQRTMRALRRGVEQETPEQFPQQLLDVMSMLGDNRRSEDEAVSFKATPVAATSPNVFLLGSSTFSAQLAGRLGLPFSFAQHFSAENMHDAVDHYRAAFQPSAVLDEPYLIIATAALVAETDEEALRLSMPSRLMTVNIRRNISKPILSVETASKHADRALALAMTPDRVSGSPDTVTKALRLLAEQTDADELMVTTVTHDISERLASMRLLADTWMREDVAEDFGKPLVP